MDESLERVIRKALYDARKKGLDEITQTELAVRAGRQTRPDITASQILAVVRRLQRQ